MSFYAVSKDIYMCDIPYEDGFTCSFIFENNGEQILADFGATKSDVDNVIVPALQESGFNPRYLLVSHLHPDHCGGLEYATEIFPNSKVLAFAQDFKQANIHQLKDGEVFLNRYKVINLKGHTDDGLGVLDTENGILVSFDCLQQYGIGNYGINIDNPTGYVETLNRVGSMDLKGIISSHAYFPLGISAFGNVKDYLEISRTAFDFTLKIALDRKTDSPEEIARTFASTHPELPKISAWTFMHILEG